MKELLFSVTKKDLIVQTFRAGGKGGQNQNKRDTGVRIIHPDSGARGESREHRTQLQNKRAAFRRMIYSKEFQLWHRIQSGLHAVALENVKNLNLDDIKIEVKRKGRWVEVDESELVC